MNTRNLLHYREIRKSLILSGILGLSINMAWSQTGLPYSKTSFCPSIISEAPIPENLNTSFNPTTLLSEDAANPELLNRAGVGYGVDINLADAGAWHDLPNGDRMWRMQISATDATNLALLFNHFELAIGAELYVYDVEGTNIQGPLTHLDNPASHRRSLKFESESIILELYEPDLPTEYASKLSIDRVSYGYRPKLTETTGFEDCYTNIACSIADEWQTQSKSVVRLTIYDETGEVWFASGYLVNNTCNDGIPYLITSFHNFDFNDDCSLSSEERLTIDDTSFDFNYSRLECSPESELGEYTSIIGAEIVSECSATDMILLKLSTSPSNLVTLTGANPYLSGWDAASLLNTSNAVVIHHAWGFPKKFSIDSDGISSTPPIGICGQQERWKVTYESGFRIGKGASGSPLFDGGASKRVIGTHSAAINATSICPEEQITIVGEATKLSESFVLCDFNVHLNPELGSGLTTCEGMWFSDRNNQCEGDYWGDAGNGGGGIGSLNCINEDPNDPNDLPLCSFSPVLNQTPFISGREYSGAERNIKAQLSITTGVDDNGNGVVIKNNSDVTFRAYHRIELGEGFRVEGDSRFVAEVRYCCDDWDLSQWRLSDPSLSETQEYDMLSPPLGMNEQNRRTLQIVPNPTTGFLTLNHTQLILQLEVYDSVGRRILQIAPNTNITSIDLSGNAAGIYTVRATLEDGRTETHRAVLSPP